LEKVAGYAMEINNRRLIIPSIERAFREALHGRLKLPPEILSASSNWPIKLSRYGRLT